MPDFINNLLAKEFGKVERFKAYRPHKHDEGISLTDEMNSRQNISIPKCVIIHADFAGKNDDESSGKKSRNKKKSFFQRIFGWLIPNRKIEYSNQPEKCGASR